MQFAVAKSALAQALSMVGRVVEKKTSIPILSNVKLHADADSLTITGTDLELALCVRVEAKVATPGDITLPAKKLFDYIRLLPEGDINFKIGENNWATITMGRSRTRVSGMSPESFPELPPVPETVASMPTAVFLKLIERTRMAISQQESRFTLNGALVNHRDGKLEVVATDGHRLAYAVAELTAGPGSKFILPLSAIKNLPTVIAGETFGLAQDENHLFFVVGTTVLISRKMTGNFPDYERVLPKESEKVAKINRLELAGALSRVAQFADERSRAGRVSLKSGEIEVSAQTVEAGESSESVACEYDGVGLEIGFNVQYLLEFLSAASDAETVEFRLNDQKGAGELRPAGTADYRYVVMPMRI